MMTPEEVHDVAIELTDKLRFERRQRKINQYKASKDTKLAESTISHIETLHNYPTLNYFIRYADYLGFKVVLEKKDDDVLPLEG